ncbi:hypothetical protein BD410DRAFT_100024 [Rickenella mellea]|uniref:F-box domain-containing protein n=1 Tax=Rickenella mellea TaxID=50990 RepID=A0A4Y7PKP5_9AGAM|nr:hypothetical protein BD410DRAFT_100024 [Rickenella mellea]
MARISEDNSTVRRFEKSLSTAQTLMPELLYDIFLHCVSRRTDWVDDWDPRRSLRCLSNAPLLLGRVCSSWRSASISSPGLWADLAVGDANFSLVDFEKDFKGIQHWISKSGSRPLSILIYYPQYYSYGTLLSPILESLVSQSWRWEEITLTVPSEFENIIFAPFRTGNLPQLVKFSSNITGDGSAEIVLSSAPRLQSLQHYGEGAHIDFRGATHDIKWIEINHADDLDNWISLTDLFTCFTHCPMLENLNILILREASLPDELPPTIKLPHLTHLLLLFSTGIDPGRLFDRLFLPMLISLELFMKSDDIEYTDWPHIQTMLARSRPPLKTVRLDFVPITEATLIGCLSFIPTLVSLEFEGVQCSDAILGSLIVDEADAGGSNNLCPWLERIDFGNNWHFSERALIEMIVSRMKNANNTNGTRGRALTFIQCPFAFRHIRSNPDISECLKDGLVLMGCD